MAGRRLRQIALLTLLSACACLAHADDFVAISGKDQLTFSCKDDALIESACKVESGAGEPARLRFSTQATRYVHLFQAAIEKAIQSDRPHFPLDAADASLLRGLALDKCHPEVEYGDLYQLCVPSASPSTVVLFVRGLCDRCEFEPIIFRKQASSLDRTYTLYRNSVTAPDLRIHIATFDASQEERYNRENCDAAAKLFGTQPGAKTKFWCEKGRFRE